jgi:hypothetical protein
VLTIHPRDKDGNQRWELADAATLDDVTHLGCRSARYTPATAKNSCSPENVRTTGFPVNPGAAMPVVNGCRNLSLPLAYGSFTAYSLNGVGSFPLFAPLR